MKTKFTAQQLEEISRIQERDNITRKAAVKKFSRQLKAGVTSAQEKRLAAPGPKRSKKTKTPRLIVKLTAEQVSANRKEGLRLFALAGRPSKSEFKKVFGQRGHLMTWEQRAAALNLGSAEECAKKFSSLLGKNGKAAVA